MKSLTNNDKDQAWIPNHEMSHFVEGEFHDWHIQLTNPIIKAKAKKTILFIHGLGSSTITWRDILPLCAEYQVFAIDLPGHGLTKMKVSNRSSLTKMSFDIQKLLISENFQPNAIIGHSSGAAIALMLACQLKSKLKFVVSINGSFENFNGLAGTFFPLFARALALTPLSGQLFSNLNKIKSQVTNLLGMTGSKLDEKGAGLYERLISDPKHVTGAIKMMSQWNHQELLPYLGEVSANCLFISGSNDRIVHPDVSKRMSKKIQYGKTKLVRNLGHLMHEEKPREIFKICNFFMTNPPSIGQ